MAVINEGSRSRVSALFELASDLDEQISHLVNRLDEVQDTAIPANGTVSRKPLLR
ncbi:hypothetical protein [Escherichia coli]|uniref:hypothetical protein n=1 Tax=Escherichia coli TaxID=562 RepID=UPI001FD8D651|nr:hypothetical protein [Escherichia coli]